MIYTQTRSSPKMPFRDLLKKKEHIETSVTPVSSASTDSPSSALPHATPFTFVRSDTNTQEFIQPPKYAGDDESDGNTESKASGSSTPKRFSRLRKSSVSQQDRAINDSPPPKEHKRLSQRLHLGSRTRSSSSVVLPDNLPEVPDAYSAKGDEQEKEAKWEERATVLAAQRPVSQSGSQTSVAAQLGPQQSLNSNGRPRGISDASSDVNIQEAIRLHETGELAQATKMFYTLAENGNVLSQVLYGLSLRHGWGCEKDPERAIQYLSAAASNSAAIESEALNAGVKTGGAAKGELVLAIFELANCYRYGWGVAIDKAAARQYYETAANLGDTDAMDQAAWCYVEGFGGKKDKVSLSSFDLVIHAVMSNPEHSSAPRSIPEASHKSVWHIPWIVPMSAAAVSRFQTSFRQPIRCSRMSSKSVRA